jgi:hypothetical protein
MFSGTVTPRAPTRPSVAASAARVGALAREVRTTAPAAPPAAPARVQVTGLAQREGPRPVTEIDANTPIYRVQPPHLPMTPHPSQYFNGTDYGVTGRHDALFVSTDRAKLVELRQQQGYFEQGSVLRQTTVGEALREAGPGARVFVDQRLPDHSLIIARPHVEGPLPIPRAMSSESAPAFNRIAIELNQGHTGPGPSPRAQAFQRDVDAALGRARYEEDHNGRYMANRDEVNAAVDQVLQRYASPVPPTTTTSR